MTKIWTTEADYPESRMAVYNESASGMSRLALEEELQTAKRLATRQPLRFDLPSKAQKDIHAYGVIWSDLLMPLVNENVRHVIENRVSAVDVQLIPVKISIHGKPIDDTYALLVASRPIRQTRLPVKQLRFLSIPVLHGLHWRFALERRLRQLLVVQVHIALQRLAHILA